MSSLDNFPIKKKVTLILNWVKVDDLNYMLKINEHVIGTVRRSAKHENLWNIKCKGGVYFRNSLEEAMGFLESTLSP